MLIPFSETGNAATTTPKRGFDDQSLAAVFNISDSKKPTSSSASTSSSLRRGIVISISIASATLALLSIAGITLVFRSRKRNRLHALAEELGPEPWERREVDGNMVVPVRHELEGSRPVVYEMEGG